MTYKVITPVFNSQYYFERCVASLASQEYDDFDVMVIDDHSSDGTANRVKEACEHYGWQYHLNPVNRGAVANIWYGVNNSDCKPDDVIVLLDGDDQLANPNVFTTLDRYYEQGAKLTYGSYAPVPFASTCQLASPFPQQVIDDRSFRMTAAMGGGVFWNHLRTFKYELFAQLEDSDLRDPDGNYYQTAYDSVFMYPLLELAAPDIWFVPEILYLYTSDNEISDWRRAPYQCDKDRAHVFNRKPKR